MLPRQLSTVILAIKHSYTGHSGSIKVSAATENIITCKRQQSKQVSNQIHLCYPPIILLHLFTAICNS